MNYKSLPKTIAIVAAIICAAFFFAFNNSFSSSAENVSTHITRAVAQNIIISEKIYQSDDDAIKRTEDGQSFVRFQNGKILRANELASVAAAQGFDFAQAQAISLATDDFNGDGFPDLVCGYAASESGFLIVYFGDNQAFSPSDQKVISAIVDNLEFPVPFKTATFIKLADAPDFLFTGDFDRDGSKDILTAARGGQFLNLTANESGIFTPFQQINVNGVISTLAAGRKNLTDDFADVFIGTDDGRILIYEDKESIFAQTPLVQNLYAAAKQITPGNLDEDGAMDLAIVADGRLFISHGDDALLRKDGGYLDPRAGQIETVDLPFVLNNLTLGEFIWDRNSRAEIAALGTDGAIRVLTRGKLDTRPFTESEIREKRMILQEIREGRRSADSISNRLQEISNWTIDKEIIGGDTSSASLLLNARSSALPADDLLFLNGESRQIKVLNDGNQIVFDAENEAIAAIPMRLNVMQPPGLVVLRKGQIEPTLLMIAPQATFNVTKNADTNDGVCNADCSLREAIVVSNGSAGADMITFSSGIAPTLTITGSDNTAATGDLDINDSVTIMGNGSGNTVISTTYGSGCGDCKIFGVNQDGTHTTIAVSFTGVTIQNGFNDFSASCSSSFQETGGGLDFFLTGSNSYSVSNSVFNNNRATSATSCASRHGGGINVDSAKDASPAGTSAGTVTLTSVSVTNNIAQQHGGGITLAADKHDVTITNPVITGNTAQNQGGGGIWIRHSFGGTIGISGVSGSVSNNSGTQGGGIANDGNQITNINDIAVNNNTATGAGTGFSIGGGLAIFQLGALNVAGSTTLTALTINGNHADNDAGGGGGVAFGQNYATTITNCNITNNTALLGNGGGVLNQGSASTPVNTLNINGGVIRGNSATGDGTNTGFGGGFAALGTGTVPPSSSTTIFNNVAIGGVGAGEGNSAVNGGAIANMNTSATTVSGTSSIFGNTATSRGGGIFSGGIGANPTTSNTVTINNNVPIGGTSAGQGNSAPNGGGVYLNVGTFNYTATSGNNIAGNSATTSGGGLFNNGGTANLSGLIITGNTATNGSAIHAALGTTTLSGTHTVSGNINIAGGTLVGATGSTTNLTGNFSESSGTFTGNNSTFNLTGNFTYTGGTFTAGTGTFNFNGTAAQSISNSSLITFNNLTDSNTTQPFVFNNSLNVNGNLTANGASTVLSPVAAAVIGGTGTLTGTGTVQVTRIAATADFLSQYTITNKTLTNLLVDYVGTAPQIISALTYNGLRLNNASGATLASGTTTVNGTLFLTAGTFAVSTNTLVVNSTVSVGSGAFSSAASGTVNYNQASDGQTVIAANYGNLIFSNFNKVLPTTTVGIAGTFTPGTATGHTVTNSNINFNGTSAQTIPVFPYFGLTLANAAGASLGGNVTVNGALGLAAGVLNVGTNTLTLNGATAQTGGSFNSSATGTVIYNQGSDGQNVLSGTYGNLTFSNFNKILPSGTITILGTFTPGTAIGHTTTGNTITFNGNAAFTLPVFPYNNLTLTNTTATLPAGTTTIGGALTLNTSTLNVGTNTLIINGNASNTGGTLNSAATGTVNYNQGANGQTIIAATYGNLIFSNFNKIVPSSSTITILGTFSPGTAIGHTATNTTFIFAGSSAQTIPVFPYNNLTLNNASGASLAGSITVGGALTLTSGELSVGANTLTLNGAVSATGGSLSAASGTVVYNQGTNGQAVLATNYGNLTFSNFTKVLPSGTVGIAGTFTPGSAVGHTITGNTISFNGAGAQTIPAFTYNILTTATGGVKTTSGAVNAANTTVGLGTTLVVASGSTLTVTGTLTNNGTIQGLGTIVNNFTNAGTLAPGLSPGILNITGNYTNSGMLNIEIGGTGGAGVDPNGHDQVLISGTGTLGGTLNVTLTNGFTPAAGNMFVILDAASSTGTFTTTNLPDIMPNTWNVQYDNVAGTVTLQVLAPNAASVSVSGRVLSSNGTAIARAQVSIISFNGTIRSVQTNQFGRYRIDDLTVGETYTVTIKAKSYQFTPRVISIEDDITDLDFVSENEP